MQLISCVFYKAGSAREVPFVKIKSLTNAKFSLILVYNKQGSSWNETRAPYFIF